MWVPGLHPVAGPAVRYLDIHKASENASAFWNVVIVFTVLGFLTEPRHIA